MTRMSKALPLKKIKNKQPQLAVFSCFFLDFVKSLITDRRTEEAITAAAAGFQLS